MYNPSEIEPKWRKFWEENNTHKVENDFTKPKFYALDMFPYPSGAGLHVGHPKWYTANDVLARYKNANGFNVLHPMGWDAFWLPAENYAIKTWTHPRITTDNNIWVFKNQIQSLWFSYDWDREIDTTDPKYYKWTQWIFLKLFENGLAYEQDLPINYCPSCKTWLANEEVLNDFTCERCHTKVEKRKLKQWVLAITKYADRLAKDVDRLDWPEGIKEMQRNWIWRSEGCEFELKKAVDNKSLAIILHGWQDDNTWEVNWHWQAKLKSDLENLWYEVVMPIQPNPGKPELEKNLEFLSGYEDKIDENTVVVWHSMWGFTAMHFVEKLNKKINKLICVAPCFNKLAEYRQDWKNNYNLEKIKENTNEFKIILSQDDPYIPCDLAIKHFDEAGVEHIDIEKAGHFTTSDWYGEKFPELLNEITDWIRVYTTRVDTVFGMTYAVLAPDHGEVNKFITPEKRAECEAYIDEANKKSDLDRTELNKDKTWVFTGSYVINPFNGKRVPLWIADYVLWNYGTGAVMAVPAHDERDYEFAKKYDLEIIESVSGGKELPFTDYGSLVYSGEFTWLTTEEAKKAMTKFSEDNNFWELKVNYKLRDWLFSRQRYWWEPIPLVHLKLEDVAGLTRINSLDEVSDNNAYVLNKDGEEYLVVDKKEYSKIYDGIYTKIVCDYNLPLELPQVEDYEPAGDGNSPLASVPDFVNIKLADNLSWERETNTMPQWWGSCWYFLRFMDPTNDNDLVSPEAAKYWGEVDSYVWWAEHAVLHLLYARFWHKFLFDISVVPTDEPFERLRNQWMILGMWYFTEKWEVIANDLVEEKNWKFFYKETWEELKQAPTKMSKSLKNVINPDDIVKDYWADTLRLYEMYIWDFKDTAPWDTTAIVGVRRFLDKAWNYITWEVDKPAKDDQEAMKLLHKTIKKVGEDIENYKFNTAIAALMILINNWIPQELALAKEFKEKFVIILGSFAPFIAEELWNKLWNNTNVFKATWPEYDEKMLVEDSVTIAISINWKARGEIKLPTWVGKDEAIKAAKETQVAQKWIEWKEIIKEIYVPNKLVNIVVK